MEVINKFKQLFSSLVENQAKAYTAQDLLGALRHLDDLAEQEGRGISDPQNWEKHPLALVEGTERLAYILLQVGDPRYFEETLARIDFAQESIQDLRGETHWNAWDLRFNALDIFKKKLEEKFRISDCEGKVEATSVYTHLNFEAKLSAAGPASQEEKAISPKSGSLSESLIRKNLPDLYALRNVCKFRLPHWNPSKRDLAYVMNAKSAEAFVTSLQEKFPQHAISLQVYDNYTYLGYGAYYLLFGNPFEQNPLKPAEIKPKSEPTEVSEDDLESLVIQAERDRAQSFKIAMAGRGLELLTPAGEEIANLEITRDSQPESQRADYELALSAPVQVASEDHNALKIELIKQAREHLRAFRQNKIPLTGYGEFLIDAELAETSDPYLKSLGPEMKQKWKGLVDETKAAFIPPPQTEAEMTAAIKKFRQVLAPYASGYYSGQARMTEVLAKRADSSENSNQEKKPGLDCVGGFGLVIALLADAQIQASLPKDLIISGQSFGDPAKDKVGHAEPTVYNANANATIKVWEILAGKEIGEIREDIYYPQIIFHAYLTRLGLPAPVSTEELKLAAINAEPRHNPEQELPSTPSNSLFAFPAGHGTYKSSGPSPTEDERDLNAWEALGESSPTVSKPDLSPSTFPSPRVVQPGPVNQDPNSFRLVPGFEVSFNPYFRESLPGLAPVVSFVKAEDRRQLRVTHHVQFKRPEDFERFKSLQSDEARKQFVLRLFYKNLQSLEGQLPLWLAWFQDPALLKKVDAAELKNNFDRIKYFFNALEELNHFLYRMDHSYHIPHLANNKKAFEEKDELAIKKNMSATLGLMSPHMLGVQAFFEAKKAFEQKISQDPEAFLLFLDGLKPEQARELLDFFRDSKEENKLLLPLVKLVQNPEKVKIKEPKQGKEADQDTEKVSEENPQVQEAAVPAKPGSFSHLPISIEGIELIEEKAPVQETPVKTNSQKTYRRAKYEISPLLMAILIDRFEFFYEADQLGRQWTPRLSELVRDEKTLIFGDQWITQRFLSILPHVRSYRIMHSSYPELEIQSSKIEMYWQAIQAGTLSKSQKGLLDAFNLKENYPSREAFINDLRQPRKSINLPKGLEWIHYTDLLPLDDKAEDFKEQK